MRRSTDKLDMLTTAQLRARFYDALSIHNDVHTSHVSDPGAYIANARASLIDSLCEPFMVTATVMAPAFPDHSEGEVLSGYCLAEKAGYWLVYTHEEDRFYCFWGPDAQSLGARGVFGSPLGCWLA